jgi:hypothetical protein
MGGVLGYYAQWFVSTIEPTNRVRHSYTDSRGLRRSFEVQSPMNTEKKTADRRTSDRFPIERELRYKAFTKKNGEEIGTGKTVNMSSTGILFTSEQLLLPGRRVELSISWPAQLNNKCALRMVARGRVVRFDDGKAAIEIQQYEFKTQAITAVIPIQ